MNAPSRTPVAPKPITLGFASLGDVLNAVKASTDLSAQQKSDRRSAINTLARMTGRAPAEISAQPLALRRHMEAIAPARFDVGAARWANIRSLILGSLTLAGIQYVPSKHDGNLTPA